MNDFIYGFFCTAAVANAFIFFIRVAVDGDEAFAYFWSSVVALFIIVVIAFGAPIMIVALIGFLGLIVTSVVGIMIALKTNREGSLDREIVAHHASKLVEASVKGAPKLEPVKATFNDKYVEYETPEGNLSWWFEPNQAKLNAKCHTCGQNDGYLHPRWVESDGKVSEYICKWCLELSNLRFHLRRHSTLSEKKKEKRGYYAE